MSEFHASDTVGGYRLEARLGGGGFGTVWRARRVSDGQIVAIKLMPDAVHGDNLRLRADIELLAAAAAARSPHVVRVLGGGVDPLPYVVMEYIQGTDLSEELRQRQRLPQTEVIEIGLSIADALTALNEASIVHRDVKPSNVMIDREGVVKLADFGIAKIAGYDAVTVTGQLPLSVAYAAPEVWEGRAEHRSDLYAFAIVLYQCLTGQLPFRGAYAEMFYQHRTVEPDLAVLPADTAPSLVELIRACLAKAAADRPESASSCAGLLEEAKIEISGPVVLAGSQSHEPGRFGPWLKLEPVEAQPWAWHCRHESSDQQATVEVHFAPSMAYGEALRRAVAANEHLASAGAERLLQTSRLILRPGEAWLNPPAGSFQFWVAREEVDLPEAPPSVSPRIALRAAESLTGLIEAADEEAVPLNLAARELSLMPDGSLYLTHPGFPRTTQEEPQTQALAFLRDLPLTRDVRPAVLGGRSLDDVRRALSLQTSMPPLETEPEIEEPREPQQAPADQRRVDANKKLALIGAAAVFVVVAAVLAALLLSKGGSKADDGQVIVGPTQPPASATPDLALKACTDLQLPALLSLAEEKCGAGIATLAFDPSCPRGQACNRKATGSALSLGENDRSVAFVGGTGNLTVAREDGSEPLELSTQGGAQQPAWSPDGRYIAYLTVLPAPTPPATPVAPLTPGPTATPQAGTTPPAGPQFVTQLHVIEVDRPANQGVLFASGAIPNAPVWLQRYASWPQWSPDGKTLYFLSTPLSQPGGMLFGVEVPRRGNDIDFSNLRTGLLPTETTPSAKLVTVALSGGDFGLNQSYLGRFDVRPNAVEIVVQVCDGDRTRLTCGLGRWDGKASMLVAPVRDRVVEPSVEGPDAAYSFVREPNGSAGLIKFGQDTPASLPISVQPAGDPPDGAWFAMRPQLAVTRHGDALLAATAPGILGGVRLSDGASSPWRAGSSPVWYVALQPAPAPVTPPPIRPFETPIPEPTPAATATGVSTPGVVRQMIVSLTARRAGNLLAGATVVASVAGADDCANGTTDAQGFLRLAVPRPDAPAACSVPNVMIRFRVNGTLVDQTATFQAQSSILVFPVLP